MLATCYCYSQLKMLHEQRIKACRWKRCNWFGEKVNLLSIYIGVWSPHRRECSTLHTLPPGKCCKINACFKGLTCHEYFYTYAEFVTYKRMPFVCFCRHMRSQVYAILMICWNVRTSVHSLSMRNQLSTLTWILLIPLPRYIHRRSCGSPLVDTHELPLVCHPVCFKKLSCQPSQHSFTLAGVSSSPGYHWLFEFTCLFFFLFLTKHDHFFWVCFSMNKWLCPQWRSSDNPSQETEIEACVFFLQLI